MTTLRVTWRLDAEVWTHDLQLPDGYEIGPGLLRCPAPARLGLLPSTRLQVSFAGVDPALELVETVTCPEVER